MQKIERKPMLRQNMTAATHGKLEVARAPPAGIGWKLCPTGRPCLLLQDYIVIRDESHVIHLVELGTHAEMQT